MQVLPLTVKSQGLRATLRKEHHQWGHCKKVLSFQDATRTPTESQSTLSSTECKRMDSCLTHLSLPAPLPLTASLGSVFLKGAVSHSWPQGQLWLGGQATAAQEQESKHGRLR